MEDAITESGMVISIPIAPARNRVISKKASYFKTVTKPISFLMEIMKISCNEFYHLILVQIDFTGVTFIIIVITVVYTVFAVYCIGHSQNLLSQKILLQLLSFLIYL